MFVPEISTELLVFQTQFFTVILSDFPSHFRFPKGFSEKVVN